MLKPSRSLARAAQRAEDRAAVAKPVVVKGENASARRNWPLILAVAIVVVVGGYLTQRTIARHAEAPNTGVAEDSVREGQEASPRASTAEPRQPAAAPSALSPNTAPLAADIPVFQPATSAMGSRIEPPKRQNPRVRPTAPVVAEVAPEPAPVIVPPAAPPPPPVVREAPRPDPWQPLNDALARCSRDGMLGGSACEYRARLQYCNGQWGQVPQCASVPYIDHGQ